MRRCAARFLAPGAVILSGKSTNPDFDIAQIQTPQEVNEDAFSGRLTQTDNAWSSYIRVFRDQGNEQPAEQRRGPGGFRRPRTRPTPCSTCQTILSDRTTNEFKFGYNAAKTNLVGLAPTVNGIDFSGFILNLSGSVANTGIAGQGASSGITVPGGLIRANQRAERTRATYDPYTLSFIDSVSALRGKPLPEGRRRAAHDPHDDRPPGRHHLLVLEPDGVPREPAVDDSVLG